MATNEELEIYKQRYETYRHLDKLRWQMLQIAVGVGSVVLALLAGGLAAPNRWVLAVVGLLLLIFGFVMERIRQGISMNGRVLKNVGELVGDADIPLTTWRRSVSFWVAATIMALGLLCVALAFFLPLPIV